MARTVPTGEGVAQVVGDETPAAVGTEAVPLRRQVDDGTRACPGECMLGEFAACDAPPARRLRPAILAPNRFLEPVDPWRLVEDHGELSSYFADRRRDGRRLELTGEHSEDLEVELAQMPAQVGKVVVERVEVAR